MTAFFTILARFGVPSCGHVGDIFGKKGGALWDALAFVVELLLSFEFWCVWAEFGPYFLHIFEVSGTKMLPSTGWWGYAEREELVLLYLLTRCK